MSQRLSSLKILRLVAGGEGLARVADGRVAFVPGAAPGDEVEAVQLEEHRSFVRATEWRLLQAGDSRVAPACPIAERCGGCDWMHLSREAELEAKADVVSESLRRIGKLAPPPIEVVTAGSELGYRSRARFHIDEAGAVGFYARATHDVVDVAGCLVCHVEVERAFRRVQLCPREALSAFSSVEIRWAPAGHPLVLAFQPRPGQLLRDATRAMLESLRADGIGVHVIGEPVLDDLWQRYPLRRTLELFASPECFTQVNWAVNERLVDYVVDSALRAGTASFCDLYAGAGNFTLPLLASGLSGVAVERSVAATDAARRAASAQGLEPSTFFGGEVPSVARRLVREGRRFDLVVLDPPRVGAPGMAQLVAGLEAKQALLCGCDPATFARDVSALVRLGYELSEVRVFDMFPRTHHVEAVAWFQYGR